jgi:hypothetical protein
MALKKATKTQSRLRLALAGVSGSGKTLTALKVGLGLLDPGQRLAVIDTERGSAAKYADKHDFDVDDDFEDFSPRTYVEKIRAIERSGEHPVLVIDSLSHAWSGKGGILDQKDGKADSFGAWRSLTPQHNELVDTILQSPLHIIVTLRAKTDYAVEKNSQTGKNEVKKLGLGYVQRDGLEFEFDIVADMDQDHYLTVSKTRCEELDGKRFYKPNGEVSRLIKAWITAGIPPAPPAAETPYKQWLALKAAWGLSDDTIKTAMEQLGVKKFGDAPADVQLAVVNHIRRGLEPAAAAPPATPATPPPAPAPVPTPTPAPTPATAPTPPPPSDDVLF